MADDRGESRFEKPPFLSEIDKEIIEVLQATVYTDKHEFIQQLMDIFDETIRDTRLDIFEFAKNRLDNNTGDDEHDSMVASMQLKERRTKKALCEDIYDIYLFASGLKEGFPREMLHRSTQSGLLLPLGSKVNRHIATPSPGNVPDLPNIILQLATLASELESTKQQLIKHQDNHAKQMEELKKDYTERIKNLQDLIANTTNPQQPQITETTNAAIEQKSVDIDRNQGEIQKMKHALESDSDRSIPCGQRTPVPVATSEDEDESPSTQSFLNAAKTQGPWQVKLNKKKRRKTQSLEKAREVLPLNPSCSRTETLSPIQGRPQATKNPSEVKGVLCGAPRVQSFELYIENIIIDPKSSNKDIAANVTKYAANKGVRVMSCWVMRNRYVRDQVGCKISVPSNQVTTCKYEPMWPEHIICREWERRSRQQDSRKNQDHYHDSENWGSRGSRNQEEWNSGKNWRDE